MEMELLSEAPAAEGSSPRITVVRRLPQVQLHLTAAFIHMSAYDTLLVAVLQTNVFVRLSPSLEPALQSS